MRDTGVLSESSVPSRSQLRAPATGTAKMPWTAKKKEANPSGMNRNATKNARVGTENSMYTPSVRRRYLLKLRGGAFPSIEVPSRGNSGNAAQLLILNTPSLGV